MCFYFIKDKKNFKKLTAVCLDNQEDDSFENINQICKIT